MFDHTPKLEFKTIRGERFVDAMTFQAYIPISVFMPLTPTDAIVQADTDDLALAIGHAVLEAFKKPPAQRKTTY